MNLILILATLFVASNSQQLINQPGCGKRPLVGSTNKIVGGSEAIVGDWGWMCSLNYNSMHLCGGTLLNSQWILSAAHCLIYGNNPYTYTFSIGVHDRWTPEPGSQQRRISKIIVHPSYSTSTQANDIALFKLSTPVTINHRSIVPICLQDTNVDLANVDSWATGWGATATGGSPSMRKFQVTKKVLSDAECRSTFGINPSTQICAGRYGLGKDTCQGDSGGPIVYQNKYNNLWYQIGITSFGQPNCGDGGVYTRVSAYVDWIKRILATN